MGVHGALPRELRTYRIVRLTGWTVQEIRAAPAGLCDWLIAIDNVMTAPAEEDD